MDDLHVGRGVVIPASELAFHFVRSSGPGGQNVNRRATRVEVVFDIDGSPSLTPDQRRRVRTALRTRLDSQGRVRVVSQQERSQAQNRARASANLASLLERALRPPPPPRRPTKPTKTATERRLASKRVRSRTKQARAKPVED